MLSAVYVTKAAAARIENRARGHFASPATIRAGSRRLTERHRWQRRSRPAERAIRTEITLDEYWTLPEPALSEDLVAVRSLERPA